MHPVESNMCARHRNVSMPHHTPPTPHTSANSNKNVQKQRGRQEDRQLKRQKMLQKMKLLAMLIRTSVHTKVVFILLAHLKQIKPA